MIEIGGRIHRKIRALQIGMDIMSFNKPQFDSKYEDILALGEKALSLV